jgi:hypothetical protein
MAASLLDMIDISLKISLSIILIIFIYSSGSVFEVEYYNKLVELYTKPWWRWLLVGLLIASSLWCPTFTIALLLALFFYFADIEILTQ